jgi:hypothetical protein
MPSTSRTSSNDEGAAGYAATAPLIALCKGLLLRNPTL